MITATTNKDRGLAAALGWAAFLGCSWTWCIGMFLPVLLVRDQGIAAWAIFAAPNVIGAAAMGWILSRPGASERVAWSHRGAGVFFSVITIAFHCYFLNWVVIGVVGRFALLAVPVFIIAMMYLGTLFKRGDLWLAAGVFGVSLIAVGTFALTHNPLEMQSPTLPRIDLIPLAVACVFGFALNPYLDLTFLRARTATEKQAGKIAFGVGFGVIFFSMICFTLYYAPSMLPGRWKLIGTAAAWAIGAHLILQSSLTIAFHSREVARRWVTQDPHVRAGALTALAASVFPLIAGSLDFGQIETNEQIYRLYLAFYGLIFPAYVWLIMIPRKGTQTAEPTRRQLIVLGAVVVVAGPMFWMAFLGGRMMWLLPGIAVIVLSRLFLPRNSSRAGAL